MFPSVQNMKTLKMGFPLLPPRNSPPPHLSPSPVKKVFRSSFPQIPTLHHSHSSEVGNSRLYLQHMKTLLSEVDFCVCPGLDLIPQADL